MASQQQHGPRARVLVGTVVALGALLAALVTPADSSADPRPSTPPAAGSFDPSKVDPRLHHRITSVNAGLERLAKRNDHLDEQYNLAVAAVAARQQAVEQAQRVAAQAAAAYRAAHARFLQALTEQYEGGASASVGVLLGDNDPQGYLDGLNLADYLSSQVAAVVTEDHSTHARAVETAQHAAQELNAARTAQAAVVRQRAVLQNQQQQFTELVHALTVRQRKEIAHARAVAEAQAHAAWLAQKSGPPPVPGSASAQVRRVIAYAEAQVGKPYVFGAAGPDTYDCSGLTMEAEAQVGVQLPHSAADQYAYGTHVAYSQLQPGDLIFLYSPIDHVELYVGNDLAVSAADPALGIIYVHPSQDLADFAGATRLAG